MNVYSKIVACACLGLLMGATAGYGQSRSDIEAPWRIGLNAGLNINFLGLGYQQLEPGTVANFAPFKFNDGTGLGPYVGLMGEYNSQSWWGAQLRVSYDVRSGEVTDNTYPVEKKFDTRMTYLTIEPLLRINPVTMQGLHLVVGPLLGIEMGAKYDFTPAPGETTVTDLEVSDPNTLTAGFSTGLAYDIVLNDRMSDTRWYLAPFLEGSWMVHQRGRSFLQLDQDKLDDIWSTISLRAGVGLKMGFMPPIDRVEMSETMSMLDLALFAPNRYILSRNYEEYFPLVTSVFFDSASAGIPARYNRLSPSDAAAFSENDLVDPAKVGKLDMSQRMAEQMNVYYNMMNIYGARLRDNPSTTLTLIGSAPVRGDGAETAQNVKDYLVGVFGIDSSRISIEARELPRNPSGSAKTPAEDRPLTNEENRRVEFVTRPTELGTPVLIRTVDNTPIENDVVLDISDDAKIKTWQVVITGEGKRETYGPYSYASQRINPKDLMSGLEEGNFKAEVVAVTDDGQRITQTKDFKLVKKETPGKQARRYSIIFGYGQDDPVKTYDNFLRTVVAPKVEAGSKVYIVGHTDAVGDATVNYNLSRKRAAEVRDVIRAATTKLGVSATFEVVGVGEEESTLTFSNGIPEGRFYNRGVVIEVIPAD